MACAQCLAGVEHWHVGGLHVEAIVHDDPEVVPSDVYPACGYEGEHYHAPGIDPDCLSCDDLVANGRTPAPDHLIKDSPVDGCRCSWCGAKRTPPIDPAIVANVDQGAALTAHVLTDWVAQYRAMIADGVDSTTALLSITLSVNDAANDGARGHDGLVSLVAVAVQQLALHTPVSGSWLQDIIDHGQQAREAHKTPAGVHPTPTPYTDAIAQANGYVFPPWIKTMVDKLEPGEAKAVTNVPPQHPTRLKGGCTCPDPDGGQFSIGCPDHIVIPMPSPEVVEPWHGKAVESTYTGVNHGILPGQVTVTGGPRPRCSYCYGVGGHTAGCRNDPNPPRIDT